MSQLNHLEDQDRTRLPPRRTIQASFTDLEVIYHAIWQAGEIGRLHEGPAERPDIRITTTAPVLEGLMNRTLRFRDAYAQQDITIDASITDMLRLRSAL